MNDDVMLKLFTLYISQNWAWKHVYCMVAKSSGARLFEVRWWYAFIFKPMEASIRLEIIERDSETKP